MSENIPVKRTMPGMPVSIADAQKQGLNIFITPEESLNITKGVLPDSFKQRVTQGQQTLCNNYLTNHPEGAPALDTTTPDAELTNKAAAVTADWFEAHPDFAQQFTIEQAAVNGKIRQLEMEIAQAKSVQEQQSRDVMKFDKLGQKDAMQQAGIAAGNAKKAADTAASVKNSLIAQWNQRVYLWQRCMVSDYPVGPDGLFDPIAVCTAAAQPAPAQAAAKTYTDAEGNQVAVGTTMDSTDKKCPNCGATVVYDPDTLAMTCHSCGYQRQLPKPEDVAKDIEEIDFTTATQRASIDWGQARKSLECKNCGATTVFAATDTAACCPYCGSTQVMPVDDLADAMAPGGVVPFEISQQKASQLFKSWIKGKFFAPNAAKKSCEAKNFSGVYLPFWTYDSQTTSPYSVQLGYRHERTNSKGETETYYEYKNFSGIYEKFVDDELVYASKKTDNPYINAVKQFDFKKLRPYAPEFIAGFLAERYTVGLDDGWQLAKNQIKNTLRSEIGQYEKRRQHADTVESVNFNTDFAKVTFKYVLAPIWIANYKFNNEVYNFVVNGQTGKIAGKSPVSIPKVILTIVLAIIAIIIAYYLFSN